jgi:hypothetical protein
LPADFYEIYRAADSGVKLYDHHDACYLFHYLQWRVIRNCQRRNITLCLQLDIITYDYTEPADH